MKRFYEPRKLTFWDFVDVRSGDKCWKWTSETYPSGHGKYEVGKKHMYAQRKAWQANNAGVSDVGYAIVASCGNILCCNPAHLSLGERLYESEVLAGPILTLAAPEVERKRLNMEFVPKSQRLANRPPQVFQPIPSLNQPKKPRHKPRSRVDADAVRAIRADQRPVHVIAAEYSYSPSAISRIKNRTRYGDIE